MVSVRGLLLSFVMAVCGLSALAQVASADTYNVTDTTDAPLKAGATTCTSTDTSGGCTLRAAVQLADQNGGSNTLDLTAGQYVLKIPPSCSSYTAANLDLDGCDANDPSQGDLDVLAGDSLTITGAGSGTTTVDAAGIDRAFAVENGASLTLSGMTIEDGSPASQGCTDTDEDGFNYTYGYTCFLSDVPSSGDEDDSGAGGGVYTDGTLKTTADVVFDDDQAPSANYSTGQGGAIYADDDASLSLTGATFINGFAPDGSAIADAATASATISHSTFTSNDTSGGDGTIYSDSNSGSLDITSSTFTDNTAASGGVFYWQSASPLSAENSTFTGNSATDGGVVYNNGADHATTLTDDVIKSNSAYEAAVIYQDDYYSAGNPDSVTLNDDEVDSNAATYVGVGYFTDGAGVTSNDSSYIGNSGDYGGVFDLQSGSPSALTNVTMSSNSSGYGGAIYIGSGSNSPLDLTNDTIAFNSASAQGGGIYGTADAVAGSAGGGVVNTIVAENTGGDCAGGAFPASMDLGYNLDSDSSCFGYTGHPATDKPGVNPNLSMPAANGGPNDVLTDAEQANSPSVNAGSNPNCPTTDARGLPRPANAGNPCDIGAFELLTTGLTANSSAPSSGTTGQPFADTITISDGATASPSTGTTLTFSLPADETLYGATPSQGSCQTSASTVTCALGLVSPGASATVQLVLADASSETVTNTATVTNNEGQSQITSAATTLSSPSSGGGSTGGGGTSTGGGGTGGGGSGTGGGGSSGSGTGGGGGGGGSSTPAPTVSAPTAVTLEASAITTSGATVAGQITPGQQETAFFFQFGTSTSYGGATTIGQTGSSSVGVKAALTNLAAHTTYHYRLVAINASGSSFGQDMTFKTGGSSPGSVALTKVKLAIKHGKASIPLSCTSSSACRGKITIITSVQRAGQRTHTISCTASPVTYKVGAHGHATISAKIDKTCHSALVADGGKLAANLVIHPTTPQPSLTKGITLIL